MRDLLQRVDDSQLTADKQAFLEAAAAAEIDAERKHLERVDFNWEVHSGGP